MVNQKHNLTVVRETVTEERMILKDNGRVESNIEPKEEKLLEVTCKCGEDFESEEEGLRHLRNPEKTLKRKIS